MKTKMNYKFEIHTFRVRKGGTNISGQLALASDEGRVLRNLFQLFSPGSTPISCRGETKCQAWVT
jgi:hypothetical protein